MNRIMKHSKYLTESEAVNDEKSEYFSYEGWDEDMFCSC